VYFGTACPVGWYSGANVSEKDDVLRDKNDSAEVLVRLMHNNGGMTSIRSFDEDLPDRKESQSKIQ